MQCIELLGNLYIPPKFVNNKTMKSIHHIAMKYMTYVVLNKRKLDNKQEPILPPIQVKDIVKNSKHDKTWSWSKC